MKERMNIGKAKDLLNECGLNIDSYKTLPELATDIVTKIKDPAKMAQCLGLTKLLARHFEPPKERNNQPKLGKLYSKFVLIMRKHAMTWNDIVVLVRDMPQDIITKMEFVAKKPKRSNKVNP